MTAETVSIVEEAVQRIGKDRFRLMDICRAVHAKLGYFSEEIYGEIAKEVGISRVEVRDMASFYAFFARQPQGKHVIRLCNAVVERMQGADDVAKAFEQAVGVPFGQTSEDGNITLLKTSCIGMSDQAPSAIIDGHPITNIKPMDVPKIVDTIRAGGDLDGFEQVDSNLRSLGAVVFAATEKGSAIRRAVNMKPDEVIAEINKSRLRGRGGAGFPMALKWDFCRKAEGEAHYIICNADEGEPGTFKDRVVLTENPDLVFEGMTVAGYAVGACEGYLYLRAEYEYLLEDLNQVLDKRRRIGLLGSNICGREGFCFDIRIQLGAGAYICGEESALIESLEGKRGAPRDRPPFPVQRGFKNQPTSVNNVETLCCAARIMEKGAAWFSGIGTKDSTGTKLLSVSGDCKHPGVYEVEYGISVQKLLQMVGAEDAQAVQVGGPSGQCLARKDFGRCVSFEDLPTGGSVMIFGPDRDVLECMKEFVEFFVEESCGWCAPCRVGTTLLLNKLTKILDGKGTQSDMDQLEQLGQTIKTMSRCGLGQTAANPVLTSLRNHPSLYKKLVQEGDFMSSFDLNKSIQEACSFTGRKPVLESHT